MGAQFTLGVAGWLDLDVPNTDETREIKADGGAYGEGQIADEYENDPRVCDTETYYHRVRGDNGYWPPNQLGDLTGFVQDDHTKVWATVVIDSLEKIDAIDCTFGVRMKMFLVWKTDLANTPIRNKFHKDVERNGQWEAMMQKAREFGGPYKLEDAEYELFEDELIYPQSLDIRNKITAEREADPDFQILDPFEGEVWMKCFDGLYICREIQELEIFPFDVQDLHIEFLMHSRIDQDRFDLKLHTVEFSRSALELTEWTIYPPEADRKGTHGTSVRLVVVRNSRYYMESIVGPSLVFSIICVTAFCIPVVYEDDEPLDNIGDGIVDRLSVTLTMMLTSVAFKFLVADELPKISYFTMLDRFLAQHFTFIFILTMWFAIGPYILDNKDDDWLVMYGMIVFLILLTFWWLFKAWILVRSRDYVLPPSVSMPPGDAISWRWQAVPHIEIMENGGQCPERKWVPRNTLIDRDGTIIRLKAEIKSESSAEEDEKPVSIHRP